MDKLVLCILFFIFYDMFDFFDEEVFRLRDYLYRIEGSMKEESDKCLWLEK